MYDMAPGYVKIVIQMCMMWPAMNIFLAYHTHMYDMAPRYVTMKKKLPVHTCLYNANIEKQHTHTNFIDQSLINFVKKKCWPTGTQTRYWPWHSMC